MSPDHPKPRIAVVFGTRPEVIKLYPVVRQLSSGGRCTCLTMATGQQREMQHQAADALGMALDYDLQVMRPDQGLAGLSARLLNALDEVFAATQPELVLVQGDTSTALCGALAAFYRKIPVGHVEAGLRTGNLDAPFPEEGNRRLIAGLAELHFAPTARARDNLLAEGISSQRVLLTGNTIVDALELILARLDRGELQVVAEAGELVDELTAEEEERPLVLVTGHRRENFGPGIANLCRALAEISTRAPHAIIAYPVHLNPNVRGPVQTLLADHPSIRLLLPLDHPSFLHLLRHARVVLTDSGGIQEEATALGKPTLILRDTTERPEAVDSGVAELVGTDTRTIVERCAALLTDEDLYRRRCSASRVFGDGRATERIVERCLDFLGETRRTPRGSRSVA